MAAARCKQCFGSECTSQRPTRLSQHSCAGERSADKIWQRLDSRSSKLAYQEDDSTQPIVQGHLQCAKRGYAVTRHCMAATHKAISLYGAME